MLCDLSPRPLLRIAGHRLPLAYRTKLERYRYGMGVFKVDWALVGADSVDGRRLPPRRARCISAAALDEIAASEQRRVEGTTVDRPFVLLSQPTLFDPSRAPAGKHVAWGYCHVPGGSTVDMLERIERQIERFAPGFRDCVLARSVMTPADIEAHNANLVGGDIAGRRHRSAAVLHAADVAELLDAGEGSVSLFGVHAARRRRARDVRILGGQTCD